MNKIRKSMSVLFVSVFVLAACGTTAPAPVPKAQLYSPVIAAAAGVWASYAILSCGSLYGWGGGLCGLGEFSDCRDVNAIEFAPLRIMADVVAISANGAPVRTDTLAGRTTLWPHAMAIDTQGNLWGWGYNRLGQLGIGSIEAQRSPVLIMTDIIAVSAGSMHTLAIDKNNTLWAWGNNEYGQLGNGNKKLQARPVAVMDNIAMVSAGINHSVALDAEGYLWTWGLPALVGDGRGRYGACQNVPYRLMGDVIYISTGRFNTFIICTNNTLWGWGANNWGQLGNGTFEQSLYPVKIKDDVISVITNHDFALVITKDDTLWG
ncbi:MAG: hypothetical protein FWB71_00075 [Defluviitaleaceae bacterium]|nr:hypothetical protein [Defluviitaleaceae bacterium]